MESATNVRLDELTHVAKDCYTLNLRISAPIHAVSLTRL